jgi:hypothetical protein
MIEFAVWLSDTDLSHFIQRAGWAIPALQSVHILAIAAVLSSTLFINLRLLKRVNGEQPIPLTVARFMPWVWCGLAILLATGLLLVIGEPRRELTSVPFWIKMGLIAFGAMTTAWFQTSLRTTLDGWSNERSAKVRLYAVGIFLVWLAVITAGRLIAYVY